MRSEQWARFRRAARREAGAGTPVALIVDSPWMPGHAGIGHLPYFLDPEVWFETNRRMMEEFPEVTFLPSWWVEYGMAIEPSAFGSRVHFYPDHTPDQTATLLHLEDVAQMAPVNPRADGLMPFALERYRMAKARIFDAGYTIPVVASRGPLCIASFLRGVTPLMMDIAEGREEVHALFRLTTKCVIDWLAAQAEVIGDAVDGILVLDDIAGFLSLRSYREFAHPYLKQICDAFPPGWVKIYHNDANTRPFLGELPDAGFDVLNWSDKIPVAEARQKTAGRLTFMGNVPTLDMGVRGTPDQVREAGRAVVAAAQGEGLILSFGGGVSPGTPAANIHALAEAAG
jgi:uroporphyrinogen decarboxylase